MSTRKLKRTHSHYAPTGRTSSLVKRMFGVKGVEMTIQRRLSRAAKRQGIIHFGQPNGVMDRRDCGIPVTVDIPQAALSVQTRLVPQWRFGKGMRKEEIMKLMRGKNHVSITEGSNGHLVLQMF